MTLYAAERIDDAVSLTKSLLTPFDAGLWARLTIVVFFLGAGSGGGNVTSSISNLPSSMSGSDVSFDPSAITVPGDVLAIIGILVAGLLLIWLLFMWIGATMEFVFVESLAEQAVAIRRGVSRHARRGLRLLGFRLGLFGITVAILGVAALALFWGPVTTVFAGGEPTVNSNYLVFGIGALVLLGVFFGILAVLIHGLTTEFLVPIMLRDGCGVLAGWGRLWPTIRAQWKQYLAYLGIAIVLRVATATAAGIVVVILTFVLAIPFVIVGLLLGFGAVAGGGGGVSIVLLVGVVLLFLAFLLTVALAGAAIYVPVQSFHRYFALLFIGDVESNFDVLGELRPSLADDSDPSASA